VHGRIGMDEISPLGVTDVWKCGTGGAGVESTGRYRWRLAMRES